MSGKRLKITPREKRFFVAASICFVLLLMVVSVSLAYAKAYDNKILPGVRISSLDLSGQTRDEARALIQSFFDKLLGQGLVFSAETKKVNINPIVSSPTDPDLSYEILSFDVDGMADAAYAIGHEQETDPSKTFVSNLIDQAANYVSGTEIAVSYKLNEKKLGEILQDNFKDLVQPANDARFTFSFNDQGSYNIQVLPEKLGQDFDYEAAISQLKSNLQAATLAPIDIASVKNNPQILATDIEGRQDQAREIINIAPLTLSYEDQKWTAGRKIVSSWIEFAKEDDEVTIGLNKEKVEAYLGGIAKEIYVPASEAKFELTGDRVTQFADSQVGIALDVEETRDEIIDQVLNNKSPEIMVFDRQSLPQTSLANANNLGIKELLGAGTSNFQGSPKNRRTNIRVGMDKLNGILIKPGEEFSLVSALGKIDASAGFLPELVIKGDRTTPEFGGGLCQIATTTFRAALYSGLPITARQSHSYRVSYYEPAGMDATIYSPRPDLKFINDTGFYILFVTKMAGTELTFEFWGTADGRKAEMTSPEITNIVKPPPLKIVKTIDLAPGVKKCTESAHNGADAKFTRTITLASGEVKTETYKSHYRPWQAVCLLGVKPEEMPQDQTAAILSPDSAQSDVKAN